MPVEFLQLLRRDPKLLMISGTHGLDGKSGGVVVIDLKGGDIARILGIGPAAVPLVADLTGVAFVQNGIKDGLFGEPGRIGGEVS